MEQNKGNALDELDVQSLIVLDSVPSDLEQ
jgi:hypothetical protein